MQKYHNCQRNVTDDSLSTWLIVCIRVMRKG